MIELKKAEIPAFSQFAIKVLYDDEIVGEYFTDILVDNKVIVELKASKCLAEEHEAQLLNYLRQLILKLDFYLTLVINQRLNVRHLIIRENNQSAFICEDLRPA